MKKSLRISIILSLLLALALPLASLAADVTSYTSGFQIQNLEGTEATIVIEFYNQSGTVEATVNDTIDPNSSNTYYPLAAVGDGFNGSVAISSSTMVAAIANVLGNGGAHGASYIGFSEGATTVNLPLVMKNNFGISTWFNVQNAGGTGDAAVTIAYAGTACTENATIAPNAAHTFDQATNTCLPNPYVGAATITSDQPVAASVIQVTTSSAGLSPNLLAYNGFTVSSVSPVMPLVSSGWYGSGTGIQIQNTGGTATDVTVSYTPSAGFAGAACTETRNIPAGQSVTFGFPTMPVACYTAGAGGPQAFVGSAKVTVNSAGHPLNAIVNQVTPGTPSAAAYGAFSPEVATTTVSLPLIMDRNFGIFTGFSVANLGVAPTNISCTFSGTAYTASANNVAPGAALTDVQGGAIANGYVGSAVCTSSGEPIAAVVNQLNTGTVIPGVEDGLLVSEGINY